MDDVWATAMVSGGLFAGGVTSIAWERVPVWRRMPIQEFRREFAQTLRRVDRLQPVLLSICIVSTIGFAAAVAGAARTLAVIAAAGFVLILAGFGGLVDPDPADPQVRLGASRVRRGRLRERWFRGHLARTVVGVALFVVAVVAAVV